MSENDRLGRGDGNQGRGNRGRKAVHVAFAHKQPRTALKYLSTHPSPADRVERLKALAAQSPDAPIPLLLDSDWDDLKKICSGPGG